MRRQRRRKELMEIFNLNLGNFVCYNWKKQNENNNMFKRTESIKSNK